MAQHSCPRCSPSPREQVFHGPTGCPVDAIGKSLRVDTPALSRMGVALSRWERWRVRWRMRLHFFATRQTQAIVLRSTFADGCSSRPSADGGGGDGSTPTVVSEDAA